MKKLALAALSCLVLAALIYTCKKNNVADNGEGANARSSKLKVTTAATVTDDTKSLQSLINAGNVTLTAGKTYHVTSLNVTHSINMNGATIVMTSTGTYTFALRVTVSGVSITNGTISGAWSNTAAGNANGYSGIYVLAGKCTISHVNLSSFSAYGIVVGPYSGTVVIYCNISNTGYIGFFYDAESASTSGGIFSNNTVDRSMVPAATVQQMAIGVRGSVSKPTITT